MKGMSELMIYHLAIDIGASSGRHILGYVQDGKLITEEVHRFANGISEKNGQIVWDHAKLLNEIITGMKKCAELGKIPETVGIDTWGVDFVLLDEQGRLLGLPVSYRDGRTSGMPEEVAKLIPADEMYSHAGIQSTVFNTVYQLMAMKKLQPELFQKARTLLFTPDYFHFLLTGLKMTEYSMASTSGLLNAKSRVWDDTLIEACGFPRRIFCEILPPGSVLGMLTHEITKIVGFNCYVVLPTTHDTGSAVMAVPFTGDNAIYISSGTWSLVGVEQKKPDCSQKSFELDFSNEGGYDYRYRYLKNITGLWMIQSLRREHDNKYSFDELCELATNAKINSVIDCNGPEFLAPESITETIRECCARSNQQIPETVGETAAVIYASLAHNYKKIVLELESLTGTEYSAINIVGGGSNDNYLNRLAASVTGRTVYAGPTEATAIGNLLAQMITTGELRDLRTARELVVSSYEIKTYQP